jgi:hypothetical protein
MKRSIRILAFFFCLTLLSGCAGQHPMKASDLDFTFFCKIKASCSGQNTVCSFSRSGPEDAEMKVLEGGSAGMGFDWSGDGFTLTYQGLAAKSEKCVLPDTSFEAVLVRVLDEAQKPGVLTWTHGNEFSGNAGGDDFLLTADPNSGQIQTVSVPGMGVSVQLYDYEAVGAA